MEAAFFTNAQILLDKSIKSFMQSTSDALVTQLQPVLITALTIYFMCKAWSIMYGNGEGSMKQLTMQVIKMAFVVALFCNAPNFYNYIADPVYKLDEPFVEIISKPFSSSSIPKNSLQALDTMYVDLLKNSQTAATKMLEEGMKPTPMPILGGLTTVTMPNVAALFVSLILLVCISILILCTVFATFAAFAILVSTTIGLSFVLAFGPLFGAFLLFPQTKQLFDSWLKQCLNFVLTKIFVVAAIYLMAEVIINLFGFEGATDKSTMPGIAGMFNPSKNYATYAHDQLSALFEICITFIFGGAFVLLFGLFIVKLPSIATSLTGGAEMNGGGAAQRANQLAGAAGGLVTGGVGGAVGKAIGQAAGKAATSQEAKGHKWRAGALKWMEREFTPKPKESSGPSKS